MTNIDFTNGDRVVTSRGVYGNVVKVDKYKDVSAITIGKKLVYINNNQLIKVEGNPYVVCYCIDNNNEKFIQRVTLDKQFTLFDHTKDFSNPLLDYCTKIIANKRNDNFQILKIRF